MQPIVYVDTSVVRAGKLDQLKAETKGLVAFIESRVPQLISYGFFFDGKEQHMTVVAVHPDSASLAFHMDVGASEFRKFADLIDLLKIDVYGPIDESVQSRLHDKARMLGRGTVTVHELHAGFAR